MNISIIETRTVPTIKIDYNNNSIIFHSKYDPIREANGWSKNALNSINAQSEIIIIGLGSGYHIKQLAEAIPESKITVIEFNHDYFQWFMESIFHEAIKKCVNVSVKLFSNLPVNEQHEMFSPISSSNILIHKNGLDIMPSKYSEVKAILQDMQFKKESIKNQIDNMTVNFARNISLNDEGIKSLQNAYHEKPMILISAGPSLDKQMNLLKKIYDEGKVILGAVGTAIKPLQKYNILPHFFTIIDPNPSTYTQLTDMKLPETTLFYLSTAYHDTIMLHKGPRRILWQEGFLEAEKMAKQLGDPLIQTGGSVATALLDLMVHMGASKIALIGQDLAYTEGLSHASNAHAQKKINETTTLYSTLNYNKTGKIPTARNLNIYRKWFEDYAGKHPDLDLFNCTEGGAYINHWEHISLVKYYESIKRL